MKVLYITNSIEGNDGWSRYSKDVISNVSKNGHEVLVLVGAEAKNRNLKGDDFLIIQKEGLFSPLSYLSNPFRARKLAQIIKKEVRDFHPEVVHFLAEPYVNSLAFLKLECKKVFLTVHGTYSYIPALIPNGYKKILSKWLFKRYYNRLSKIIAVSNYTSTYMKNAIKKDWSNQFLFDKITVLNNGIDLQAFGNVEWGKNHNSTDNRIKNIFFVGAVKPRKGLLEAVKALKLYKERFGGNFLFQIAGKFDIGGAYYKELQDEITISGLGQQVKFLGTVSEEEKIHLYRNSDVFMMMSIQDSNAFEGFGLVYLEANAFGVPTLGSRKSGASNAIKDGYSGFLVDSNNPEEIVEKLNQLFSQQIKFRIQSRKWAEQHDISYSVVDLVQLYKTEV